MILRLASTWRARAWRDDVVLWQLAVRGTEPRRLLGRLAWRSPSGGEFGPREKALRRATTIDPSSFKAQLNLGVLLQMTRRSHEAAVVYRKALALQPQNVNANLNMGLVSQEIGDQQAAYAAFDAASTIDPNHFEAQRLIAGWRC